jgi:hypothetical protein
MMFDTLIDSVSSVYGFNTIGIHLANPSRTRHTFLNYQLGELCRIINRILWPSVLIATIIMTTSL